MKNNTNNEVLVSCVMSCQ